MTPNNQQIFRVFQDEPYEHLGPNFDGLSIDGVLGGMEGQQDYVYINGVKLPIGFDRTLNSIAVLDYENEVEANEAVELLSRFAKGELSCSPENADKSKYVAVCNGMNYTFEFWA